MLFLVDFSLETVHSPGDDGMSEPVVTKHTRIVEADDDFEAEYKVRERYEQFVDFRIRVDILEIEAHKIIT